MGSGKTTLGKKLARRMSFEFIDLDKSIEKKTGKTINHIFNKIGEDFFREEERKVLKTKLSGNSFVMAVGGGTPCFFNNMELMNQSGLTIYLKLTHEKIFERLKNKTKNRPLVNRLNNDDLMEYIRVNLAKREKWYLQSALIIEDDEQDSEILFKKIQACQIRN